MTSLERALAFRENYRQQVIPKSYSGLLHLAFSASILVGLSTFCLRQVESPTLKELMAIPAMLVVGNFFVFFVHKYLLHRTWPKPFDFAYKIHTLQHHHFYTDEIMVYDSTRDFHILLFPPFVVIAVGFIMGPVNGWWTAQVFDSANVGYLVAFGHYLYFMLYEIFHFMGHLPENHILLKFYPFQYMYQHHKLHHRLGLMAHFNFNIVYPLADIIFGANFTNEKDD